MLENESTVAMECAIKVAPVDEYMPLDCTALTNVGYEPKFANDAFSFKETVTEMWQRLDKTKAEIAEQKQDEPMITEERHQVALAATHIPMYASQTSNITMAPMPGVEFVDSAKYHSFLGVIKVGGEEVTTASAGAPAQASKGFSRHGDRASSRQNIDWHQGRQVST